MTKNAFHLLPKLVLLAFGVFGYASCTSSTTTQELGCEECPFGQVCQDGQCVCENNNQCAEGAFCNDFGTCQKVPPCTVNSDCGDGFICDATDETETRCIPEGTCTDRIHCDTGERCDVSGSDAVGVCVTGCDTTADCALGAFCQFGECVDSFSTIDAATARCDACPVEPGSADCRAFVACHVTATTVEGQAACDASQGAAADYLQCYEANCDPELTNLVEGCANCESERLACLGGSDDRYCDYGESCSDRGECVPDPDIDGICASCGFDDATQQNEICPAFMGCLIDQESNSCVDGACYGTSTPCTTSADCANEPFVEYCTPACRDSADCPAGFSGCGRPFSVRQDMLCTTNEDCAQNPDLHPVCFIGAEEEGGYCQVKNPQVCASMQVGSTCNNNNHCVAGIFGETNTPCQTNSDCTLQADEVGEIGGEPAYVCRSALGLCSKAEGLSCAAFDEAGRCIAGLQ